MKSIKDSRLGITGISLAELAALGKKRRAL